MTATDYGRVRCSDCGTWYGLDESHTCPPADFLTDAVLRAAFPEHGRMATNFAEQEALEARASFRLRVAVEDELRAQYSDEDFEHEVRRVMWAERCTESTAVHRVGADRRLGVRRARAAA